MSEREKLKVSTRVVYDELLRQGIETSIIDASSSLLSYRDHDGQDRILFSTLSDKSSATGSSIANNKQRTSVFAQSLGIPVPAERVCQEYKELLPFFALHRSVVVKPLCNSGGTGVTVNIQDEDTLKKAYLYARHYDSKVIVQQYIKGTDLRMLVVNGVFRSAVERRPAHVVGNGVSTVKELIYAENKSSKRQYASMAAMDLIDISGAQRFLGERINTIPTENEYVRVLGPANLSRGGTAHEATHLVSADMIADAEQISSKLRIGLCGVDLMWNHETGEYFLIEINATPGVNMHNDPFWGTSSDAISHYVKWLVSA